MDICVDACKYGNETVHILGEDISSFTKVSTSVNVTGFAEQVDEYKGTHVHSNCTLVSVVFHNHQGIKSERTS